MTAISMVFRTLLLQPAGAFCCNRLPEWMTSAMMIGISFAIAITPATIERGNLFMLTDAGLTSSILVMFFAIVGAARIYTLVANGNWPIWGPRLRCIGTACGALIWLEIAVALLKLTPITGTIAIGVPVFFFLMVGELISCYVAATDVRFPHL